MNAVAPALRVVSLQAQNIMRLTAVEIDWDPAQSTLTVGGRNGAGKSSVLNAVAMALGGKDLCPEEPIRRGEASGFVEVSLGELTVRREFSRERIVQSDPTKDSVLTVNDGPPIDVKGASFEWGETKSRLVVRNAEGVSLGTPQAVLNKLIGTMTFDPFQFVTLGAEGAEGERRQADILRRIVGLDFADVDERRRAAAERRAHWNREHKAALARLEAMPVHKDAPDAETPMEEISNEMLSAERLRKVAEDAERHVAGSRSNGEQLERQRVRLSTEVDALTAQLKAKSDELARCFEDIGTNDHEVKTKQAAAEAARAAVPDAEAIRKKLTDAEAANAKARANKAQADAAKQVAELKAKADAEDAAVKAADREKEGALKAAQFPVEGLGLSDAGVTFGGLPFSQASTAEQIRTSVAIGFALNPGLRLLLVRNGNALDEDSLRVVAAQAEAAGGQILMEYVTKDAGEVSVMIEDGRVA